MNKIVKIFYQRRICFILLEKNANSKTEKQKQNKIKLRKICSIHKIIYSFISSNNDQGKINLKKSTGLMKPRINLTFESQIGKIRKLGKKLRKPFIFIDVKKLFYNTFFKTLRTFHLGKYEFIKKNLPEQ